MKRGKRSAREVYQPPGGESIGARASAMRSAFVRSLIPNVPPSERELADAFSLLKLDADDLRCVYCGDPSTEWDHFFPVMRKGRPTGYLTRIQNLVPACGKCNQSKGNRDWKDWMTSAAPLSPTTRGVSKLSQRVRRLQAFEAWGAEAVVDFETVLGSDAMKQHNDYLKQILSLMNEAEAHSKALRTALLDELPYVIQEKKPSLWKRFWRLVFGGR
ncbi:HNH endonuclease [Roseibacillus persicicus]|uniref:HNH endonuclease n=1 Tax=Roseibacillus persicicus TaxID=454148 RepID=UPI00280FE954|nr:HNH endonuclease [Roseibacillus persicicus]MDQ8191568.1 HNH endonuclease [Roseibacillus persicicus]